MPNLGCMLGIAYQTEVARLSKSLEDAGVDITAAEYLIMRVLLTQDDIQQCEISRILGKDKASICRSIQSLVKKGKVKVTPLSYKCSIVSLTDGGKSLKPRLLDIAQALQLQMESKISPQQADSLREILEKIIN